VNVERVLRLYGVALSSVTEYVDTTTSVGRFNFRSIGSVAELERELIGERARLGLHALAKEGKWPNSHPPLGFGKKNDGKLVTNQEVKLVLKIFKMYLKNPALPQVAFDLNKNGIRTKAEKRWNATGVRNIITNEIYIGRYSVAGVKHYVEDYRIMSDNLFQRVQRTLLRYKTGGAKRPPMPENRRNAEIDAVFNQFFKHLHATEDDTANISTYKTKTLTGEKELYNLLNKGWNLMRVNGNEFTVRKPKESGSRT
jgi:site-specific DNA recombinase